MSDRTIDGQAEAGRLHPVLREVFAVGHRAIDREGQMLAAVLACGEGTVVSHGSAAELLGLWDKRPVLVNVIAGTQAGRKIDGVRWHRVLPPEPREVVVVDGVPCTTVARTLVDLAGCLSRKTLSRLVEQAAVLRAFDIDEVDRILARGRRRGAPQLRAILDAWRSEDEKAPRLRSLLEARLFPGLIEAGLPRPQCNVELRNDGRRLEVDLFWEEQRLVIETDGEATHGTRAAFQRDRHRDQILVAAGYRIARITWRQLEDEPEAVVARIKRMLAAA